MAVRDGSAELGDGSAVAGAGVRASVAPAGPSGDGGIPVRLARQLLALPPSCGPVRLVAVDGHAGAGKTTFAAHLAAALGRAPVVHLDDLATHAEPFGWVELLRTEVLEPLAAGLTARHRVYDWTLRRFADFRTVPPAPVVLIEGVGAGRRELRPLLSRLIWMELDATAARARGELRDGPELAEFWVGWTAAEQAHFAANPSRPYANLRVDGLTGRVLFTSLGEPLSDF